MRDFVKRFLLAALLAACLSPTAAYADKLKVVASFSILGDMVREVGGDQIDLTVLVGPNSDAHMFEPTPADVKAVSKADLFVVNGFGFEGWIGRLVVASGYTGKVLTATEGITPLKRPGQISEDPHAWQNLSNGKIYVANIRDALIKADSRHATEYRANAYNYLKRIDEMDAWVKEQIATVPPQKRQVISSHDAFQYFARAYDVQFIAPLGVSTESDASAESMARLEDKIRNGHVKALFLENITDNRMIQQLKNDTDAYIGGELHSDALSASEGPANTYLNLFKNNVQELTRGMLKN
jgi:zinc/manganese transport system substrate-binding protein